jgi:hypothetical protein
MFNARPVVNIFYRKTLDNNIYKQSEFGGDNGVRLVIDYVELVKVALKKGGWGKEWE